MSVFRIINIAACISLSAGMWLHAQTVNMHLWATGENHNDAVKTVPLLNGYTMQNNGDDLFNRYGSDSRIKTNATGFFYVKKIDGRWWLIDPDGYAGVNMAVTSLPTMTGTTAAWAFNILRKNGYNGTGNFLATEGMTKNEHNANYADKISYTRRKNFFANYMTTRQTTYIPPTKVKNNPGNYITVFDPEFESFADNFASTFANYKNERELMGYFSDNEINFNEDQLKLFLQDLSETDPNYIAALNYINSKGVSKATLLANYASYTAMQNEFLGMIVERYFSVVRAAIKKYDPNHLYLGSRIHGKARNSEVCVTMAAKYCDVVAVNYYNYVFPSDQIANPQKWGKWLATYDKPAIVTEFYAKAYNTSYPDQPGAGFYTDDQAGRGVFYQSSCLDLLRSSYYIGWQYFRWQDDPAPKFSNKGMVSTTDSEYVDMTSYMEELNRQVYHLIDYMDKTTHIKNTYEVTLPALEDTYIRLSGNNQEEVNGNKQELSLSSASSANGLREILLKFDLQNYKDSISKIVDAKIRLYYLSGDTQHNMTVYGVKSNNWSEADLAGTSTTLLPTIRANYGKGRMKNFTTNQPSPILLNVRNWMKDEVTTQQATFRIVPENSGIYTSMWASKENSNVLYRPALVLTLDKNAQTALTHPVEEDIHIDFKNSTISVSRNLTRGTCALISMTGSVVQQEEIRVGDPIQVKVEKGIYLVRIYTNNRYITKKIQIL
ncbi:hypothetical protein MASR2M117_20970 [Paludibacter sp.]